MVDNRKLIEPLLIFPKPGDSFYFVQILQRKKDHKGKVLGGSNNNSRLVKAYYVSSLEKLDAYWNEMTELAKLFDARVSINLNPRSFQKAGFQLMQKVANQMMNGDFYNIRRAYDTICGEYHAEMDKRWIVDIDGDWMKKEYVENIVSYIREQHSRLKTHEKASRYEVLTVLPSKTGCHIITNPFDLSNWTYDFHNPPEIHKNNPTNLFIP